MSQAENAVTSSSKAKRQYRKGSPLSAVERQQQLIARRKETHKELRVYVDKALKADLEKMSVENGLTQAAMIEKLIMDARLRGKVKE